MEEKPYYDPGYHSYPPPVQKQTNPLAIASLVCSLAGLMITFAPIVGAILGYIALQQIKKEPYKYEGKGMATAGMIIGIALFGIRCLFIVVYIFFIIFIIGMPFWFS